MKKTKLHFAGKQLLLTALIAGISMMTFSFRPVKDRDPVKPVLKGSVNISGTRFLFPLLEKWAAEFRQENPGVEILISQNVSGKDIEASAAPLKKKDSSKGSYTVVSRFALVPIANEKNPAIKTLQQKGISKEDFLNIYFKSDHQTNNFIGLGRRFTNCCQRCIWVGG